ncbi:peptidase inhibitor family I36 protein [Streptomyces oceani]|uniref:peptidase inhibitor family I36 protein n=1 Tax=Streptomyces oceani TaxID=1075402 RepID=UPI0008732261|nr:peptidase inhibitor family I36 protein [Streptomyces oceani]
MNSKRIIVGISLAVATVVATPAAGHAAPSEPEWATSQSVTHSSTAEKAGYKRCPKGYFCVFTGKDGTGAMASFKRGASNLKDFGMNNNVSSLANRTDKRFKAFNRRGCEKRMFVVGPKDLYPHIGGNLKRKYNNKMSSLHVKREC